jgi:hypothetical protein
VIRQVVERTEEEYGIERGVRLVETPGVAKSSRKRVVGLRGSDRGSLLNIQGYWIDEVNAVARLREPGGIDAGATTNIEDVGWWRGKKALEELPRADQLEAVTATSEALALATLLVIAPDVAVDHLRL